MSRIIDKKGGVATSDVKIEKKKTALAVTAALFFCCNWLSTRALLAERLYMTVDARAYCAANEYLIVQCHSVM